MSTIHQILLQPTDVLFFRDGRPMAGSLAGHTAAWPLPDVTNHALHAALHRAGLTEVHQHRRGRSGTYSDVQEDRDRKFGSLTTAGPFPVSEEGRWYFPHPKDAEIESGVTITRAPARGLGPIADGLWLDSSLPNPLKYAVGNTLPPKKEVGGENWISKEAFESYLRGDERSLEPSKHFLRDGDLADREQQIGIRIDAGSGTTGQGDAEGGIYSAHYLRLREKYRLGLYAQAADKGNGKGARDLVQELLQTNPLSIVVGGQQRICTAMRNGSAAGVTMPRGLARETDFHELHGGGFGVKWILLSPAIWPKMEGCDIEAHSGGWLPNWIDPSGGDVLLKSGDRSRREGEGREAWRRRVQGMSRVSAKLVAALVAKPIVVTGWAVPTEVNGTGGAKPTHFAVPAGAVYYFVTPSREAAAELAAAINWHGGTEGPEICNRRSTLLGEKGYGLGVCGTWNFHGEPARASKR